MKILIVFNHPAPYKVNLFNSLCKDVELDVIFERKSAKNRPDDFYKGNVFNFHTMFLKHGAFGDENSNTGELKKYLKKHHQEYDLIIMNGYSTISEMRAINYLIKNKIRFGLYINGGVIKEDSNWKYKLKKKYISSADYYFSPSEEANEYLVHYGADASKIHLYSYASVSDSEVIKEPIPKEEKEQIREKLNLPQGRLFVTASQFIERKDILYLLDIFKDLDDKLLVIGEGPQKEKYEKFIFDNNMTNVEIRDFLPRTQLFEVFKGCDYFITLSKEDIYGHTINEAMANGLPVISSDHVVAAKKLIQDGVNGYVVSLENKQEIVNAIKNVSYNMSSAAISSAKENTLEKMAREHIEIFKELVK